MFSLICNLLKMDAYSNDFQKTFLAKNRWDCQIRSNQIVASVNAMKHFNFFINRKDIKDPISKITIKDTSLYVAMTSQRC